MLFFRTKKQTTTKGVKGEQIKSTTMPENQPDFNTWCKEFNVSSRHSYHTPMPHNGVVLQQN